MKTFKKFLVLLLCFGMTSLIFAEPASTGITSGDVKNWVANFSAILNEVEQLGYNEKGNGSAKEAVAATAVLNKYGISGANAIEKYGMLNTCGAILVAEQELNSDPDAVAAMKMMGIDPLAKLKVNVNSKDFAVVQAQSAAVVKVLNAEVAKDNKASKNRKPAGKEELAGEAMMKDTQRKQYEAAYGAKMKADRKESQDEVKKINENAKVMEGLYNSIASSKGDCGFINGTKEAQKKAPVSGYALNENSKKKIRNPVRIFIEDPNEDAYDDTITLTEFYVTDKTIKFNFEWETAVFQEKDIMEWADVALRGGKPFINKTAVKKTVKFNVSDISVYEAKVENGKKTFAGTEIVVKTKEGAVFHLWTGGDHGTDYFNYISIINYSGKPAKPVLNWQY